MVCLLPPPLILSSSSSHCLHAATDPTNGDQKHGPISAVKSSIRSILDDIKKEQEKEKSGKGQSEQKDVKGVEEGVKADTTTKEEKPAGVKSTKVDWEEEAQGSFLDKLVDRSELYSPIGMLIASLLLHCLYFVFSFSKFLFVFLSFFRSISLIHFFSTSLMIFHRFGSP